MTTIDQMNNEILNDDYRTCDRCGRKVFYYVVENDGHHPSYDRLGDGAELCDACAANMTKANMTIKINVYRAGRTRTWYGARWIGGEYDGCDPLDIDDDAPVAEAVRAAMEMPLIIEGKRTVFVVEDVE